MFEKSKASRYLYLDMIGMETSKRDEEAYKTYSKNKDRLDELKAKIVQKIKGNAYIGLKTENGLWQLPPSEEDETEKQSKCLEYCKKDKTLLSEIEKDLKYDISSEFYSWLTEHYATGLVPTFTEEGKVVAENKVKYFGEKEYIDFMNEEILCKFYPTLKSVKTSLNTESTIEDILFKLDLEQNHIDTLTEIFNNIKENIPCVESKYYLYYILSSTLGEEVDIKEKDFKDVKTRVLKTLNGIETPETVVDGTIDNTIVTIVNDDDIVPPVTPEIPEEVHASDDSIDDDTVPPVIMRPSTHIDDDTDDADVPVPGDEDE